MNAQSESFDEARSASQIKRGAIMGYLGIALNSLAGLLFTPWMVQRIGTSSFGLYTLALSLIGLFLIEFGLSEAVSRFVSKYLVLDDKDAVARVLGTIFKLYIFLALIMFVGLAMMYFRLEAIFSGLTPVELERFKIVYVISATYSLVAFPFIPFNGILTAYEKFYELRGCDLLQKAASVLLTVLALYGNLGLYALVLASVVSGALNIAAKGLIIHRTLSLVVDWSFRPGSHARAILKFSAWSGVATVAQRFIFNISPSILGAVVGSGGIAIFGVAASLEGYVYTFATGLTGLFLPKVMRLLINEDSGSTVLPLMIKVGRVQLAIIGLLVAGFACVGRDFVILWLGAEFEMAYFGALLLMLPSVVYLPQMIGNTALVALNRVRVQGYVYVAMAVTNVVLSLLLSRIWGVLGACAAIFIAYSLRNIGMNMVYHRVLQVRVLDFFRQCHLSFAPSIIAAVCFGALMNLVLPEPGLWSLLCKGGAFVLVYCFSIWVWGLNLYEKDLFRRGLKRVVWRSEGPS